MVSKQVSRRGWTGEERVSRLIGGDGWMKIEQACRGEWMDGEILSWLVE